MWAVFGFQKSPPSESHFLCAGAPAPAWGGCPCLPIHVPWVCLPRRQVPSPAARAGTLLPSPFTCLCRPGHRSAWQGCPLLPLVSGHQGQDDFLKATYWGNPRMKTLGCPGVLSARRGGLRWGVCKGGAWQCQHPRMLPAPRGAARSFPRGLPGSSPWLCGGCTACPASSLAGE